MTVTPQTNATLDEIAEELLKCDVVAVCGHVNPDGDCIGSTLGLACALRAVGKTVHALVADDEPVDASFSFMPGFDTLLPASAFDGSVDAFVTVDAPNGQRIGEAADAVKAKAPFTVTIDHHAVPERYSQLSYTDPDSASATLLVWAVAKRLGISFESDAMHDVATCCYSGLLTDTGRFMHQNTDIEAFRGAADMMACGLDPARIATALFQQRTEASVKVDALAADRMRPVGDRALLSWITLDDLQALGAGKHDAENAIAPLRSIAGFDVACILKEREGCVRGSLRAKDDTDVAAIAREFGGGGHVAAAGFTLDCGIEEAVRIMQDRLARL